MSDTINEKEVIASYIEAQAEAAADELNKFAAAVFFDALEQRGYTPRDENEANDYLEAGNKIASTEDIFTIPESDDPRSLGELAKKASGVEGPSYYAPSARVLDTVEQCLDVTKYASLVHAAQLAYAAGQLIAAEDEE